MHLIFNKQRQPLLQLKKIILSAIAITLVGCGSGGNNNESANDNKSLALSKIAPTLVVNEGETVTLSINATGKESHKVSYDWNVTYQNRPLEISGQNTHNITFVAPNVEVAGTVEVAVKIKLPTGVISGNHDQNSLITILDLTPPAAIPNYERGKKTALTAVEALDMSSVLTHSTWIATHYFYDEQPFNGSHTAKTQYSTKEPLTILGASPSRINYFTCREEDARTMPLSTYAANFDCGTEKRKINYYQGDDSFRAELLCGNNVRFASLFNRKSETLQNNFGQLSLKFTTYNDQTEADKVCGVVTVSNRIIDENEPSTTIDENVPSTTQSRIDLYSDYLGERIKIRLDMQGDLTAGSKQLNTSTASQSTLGRIILTSDQLPTISDRETQTGGQINLSTTGLPVINGSFKADILDKDQNTETIEGEFSLDLGLTAG